MSDAKSIHQILNEISLPPWHQSAQVLGKTFEWCYTTLNETREDRVKTLKGLTALANALSLGVSFLDEINPIIEQSLPGPTLQQALKRTKQKIEHHEKQVNALKSDVAVLETSEHKYLALIDEQQFLEKRQKELNRICQFDENALEELRQQVQLIEETTTWLKDVENLEDHITTMISNLIVMSDKHLKIIQDKTQDKLSQAQNSLNAIRLAAQRQKELLAAETEKHNQKQQELMAAQKRYKEVTDELIKFSHALNEYAKADQLAANSISQPSALAARQLLEQIENSLHQVDEMLVQAMLANEATQQITQISL